jgi:hypothetical protein
MNLKQSLTMARGDCVVEGVLIKNLKVRRLKGWEKAEQIEQLRRAWLIKLLRRRKYRSAR